MNLLGGCFGADYEMGRKHLVLTLAYDMSTTVVQGFGILVHRSGGLADWGLGHSVALCRLDICMDLMDT